MKTITMQIAGAALVFCATTSAGLAAEIPENLVGKWAVDGSCDGTETITLTAATIAIGDGEPEAAEYFEDDSPAGNGAVHLSEEGDVSNWEFAADQNVLLFNEQGYGMGVEPVAYQRCE
ncbi:hypothetical protein [Pelagibacterium sp. H642]|uniref:hypothetical protein n=1 Tax=Pelagibacterium sp. H642 TaxID=1881069 RepID=UPI002814DF66|nr:hypothetical protein [Pelagibacterium sp. H642]WMT91961.1 hypothetical protein NO934_06815 [Pelagibacterium sp. H642]